MIGVLGAGDIAGIYLQNLPRLGLVPVAVASRSGAGAVAARHGIRALSPDELLADPAVKIVLNLTPAAAHFRTTKAALRAGKHVYCEKPIALNLDEGRALMALAVRQGRSLAVGPDTILGPAIQTARQLVAEGKIGRPVLALAANLSGGMEHRHPAPQGFYAAGVGPMVDVGPYALSALVEILGPVARFCGAAHAGRPERLSADGPFRPAVPTTVAAMLEFGCGAIGNIVTSWDVAERQPPLLAIHGTHGSITLPNPNWFGGDLTLVRAMGTQTIPTAAMPFGNERSAKGLPVADWRGLGLSEMVGAMAEGRAPRLSASRALHILEITSALGRGTTGWTRAEGSGLLP